MKQLVQKLKDGWMGVVDAAPPVVEKGRLIVRTWYSLISPGTEGATVSAARESLLGKARQKPEQVKQVIDAITQIGPIQTYRAVMKKLSAYSPLGYSLAGEVIDVGEGVRGFGVGDFVACAGAGYANHAEIVSVPMQLCVKLRPDADLTTAAYNTLGAIALQGVRQADLRLGETCVVIGLGLLGQLSALLLRASGVKVIGLDIDPWAVDLASRHSADVAFLMDSPGVGEAVDEITGGIGVDAAILTATTESREPINLSGRLLRKRGTVVVVGAVPTGFDREPHYYRKELQLKMSCSYGPGRYDPTYEEKGIDYPVGYVRWTENRNMQAFQDLIYSQRIDLSHLTTHRYKLADAPAAYDLIVNRREPLLGILLEYDRTRPLAKEREVIQRPRDPHVLPHQLGIAFIGAGSYAMGHLLPNIPRQDGIVFTGVLTATPSSSRSAADKFGFQFCAAEKDDIFEDPRTTTVFIATRHDTHATLTCEALERGKHVFVEKPLCRTAEELEAIRMAYDRSVERYGRALLLVGFNRRFSPLARTLKHALRDAPIAVMYRVNAGNISAASWVKDTDIGGGRIVGEVCHFVDFLSFLSDSEPEQIYAALMDDGTGQSDTVSVTVTLRDGSVGTIAYYANGSKLLSKEYIEVYQHGVTYILDDFLSLTIKGPRKSKRTRLLSQDKGQASMVSQFVLAAQGKSTELIPFNDICAVTAATFAIEQSLRTRAAVRVGKVG